mmetsp:Transcript_14956/g.35651  ORF Transcript_14956/g.35651 Transcript_14956/m.35651 type:complete len:222 (+) Transcript_14956:225-890(+)
MMGRRPRGSDRAAAVLDPHNCQRAGADAWLGRLEGRVVGRGEGHAPPPSPRSPPSALGAQTDGGHLQGVLPNRSRGLRGGGHRPASATDAASCQRVCSPRLSRSLGRSQAAAAAAALASDPHLRRLLPPRPWGLRLLPPCCPAPAIRCSRRATNPSDRSASRRLAEGLNPTRGPSCQDFSLPESALWTCLLSEAYRLYCRENSPQNHAPGFLLELSWSIYP